MTDLLANLKAEEDAKPADTPRDLLSELGDASDATPWIPENAGEGIQGVVLDVDSFPGDFADQKTGEYPAIPMITVKAADGEARTVKGYHTVLRKELDKKAPQVGDTLAVLYQGEREAKVKGRKPTKLYAVAVQRAEGNAPSVAAKPEGTPF